jgi:hypothetical protein
MHTTTKDDVDFDIFLLSNVASSSSGQGDAVVKKTTGSTDTVARFEK